MASRRYFVLFLSLLGICFATAVILFMPAVTKQNALTVKQEELALKLGIEIEDYPNKAAFPKGYFYTVLKPGMTIEEVHLKIIEYEQVFSCYGTDELYYYLSRNDEDALRFMIHYDNEGRFVRMYGEDDDSRTLSSRGCISGLLDN